MAAPSLPKRSTVDELLALPNRDELELVHGSIVQRAMPSFRHGRGGIRVGQLLFPFDRKPSDRNPGGWWLVSEIHTQYEPGEVFCHDVAGWRRDRLPEVPDRSTWPMTLRPDWVCEIASPSHEKRDFVEKPEVLHRAAVPHYWILHPDEAMLIVQRWTADGYITVLRATRGQTVRAEPFEAIEIRVGELFGDDPED